MYKNNYIRKLKIVVGSGFGLIVEQRVVAVVLPIYKSPHLAEILGRAGKHAPELGMMNVSAKRAVSHPG